MPTSPVSREQIAAYRQQHIGRLLLRAQRAYDAWAIAKLHARGHAALTPADTTLLVNLDTDGTRLTTLAHRAGVTKQAMGQLAHDLERKGYIIRTSDPADARATLVTFTDAGWQFLRDAHDLKREIEAEYTAVLGEAEFAALQSALITLLAHIAPATAAINSEDET